MSTAEGLRMRAMPLFVAGVVAGFALLLWGGLGAPGVALAGWLCGLVFWLGIALGAVTLLAIHALTGGLWLASLRPVLLPAAATLPVFALLALPLLLNAGAVYPWLADPSLVRDPGVVRWYVNLPGFVLRSLVALAGWSFFALLLVGGGARRPGVGAAALVFHMVAITTFGLDWVLSIEPRFRSTVFGAALTVTQLLSALAWCAMLEPEPAGGRGKAGDLAQLIIATALGSAYLGFVQFLVAWYGNLPEQAAWFLAREASPWIWLEAASVLLAAAVPVAGLLAGVARRSPGALAVIGAAVLMGLLLHTTWLVGPPFGAWMLLSATLGAAAVGGIWLGLAGGPFAARLAGLEVRHGG